MEIRQYLLLFRKWLWLLILGAIVGGAAAFLISIRQPEVYETSSRVMVSAAPDETGTSTYYIYNDLKLTTTYAQLISTDPVLEAVSEELGYTVEKEQISVKQLPDSLLLEVTVNDSDPERAAKIANSLITQFIDYNETLQARRFTSSEESLQLQIAQVQDQINLLQAEMTQANEQAEETLQLATQKRLDELRFQMDAAEDEIIRLEQQLVKFTPTPLPATATPENPWAVTATPAPIPTTSPEQLAQYIDLQQQLDQWTTLRDLYKQTYAGLLVTGDDTTTTPNNTEIRQNQLQTAMALYQQIYTNLLNNYENIRLARLRSTPNVVQIEPAPVPEFPIQPQPIRNMVLGSISGALLMGVIAFLIEFLDDTLKTPEDILQHLQIPVIGLIGEMSASRKKNKDEPLGVYVDENPLSPITESFRTLRTNLEFASVDKPIETLLITSTQPSEGKTTVAVNLSVVMAQGDRRVVLIDTDLRRPSVHRYLGISNRTGLSELFRSQTELSKFITPWGDPEVAVVSSGGLPPNPTELLSSEKMNFILKELTEMSDIVVIDAPPGIVADPIIMASKVDAVIIVIEPGRTKIDAAQVLMEQLNRAGARVVGAVLNPISRKRAHYYSKYRYNAAYNNGSRSYGNYFGANGNSESKRKKKQTKEEQPEVTAPAD